MSTTTTNLAAVDGSTLTAAEATAAETATGTVPAGPLGVRAATPRRFALVRHSYALARRSVKKMIRTPEAFMDVTLQPAIFLLLFTYVFGGAIAGNRHEYLQYLLPGILAQTIAMAATAIGVNMNQDISKGVFDRFRSLPIARSAPLVGAVLADFFRYALITVVTLVVGYAIGFRIGTNPLAAAVGCLVPVLFALCLSWLSVWIGLLARTPGAVQGIMILMVLPLSFGSDTFVTANTLPSWMHGFVNVNPITHLAGLSRGLFVGGPVADHMLWTFGWMTGLLAVFMPLALRAYQRKV